MQIIKNMPFTEYLSLPRLSSSKLKDFRKSPAFMKWREKNPMKESDAMKIGTMVHTYLLENHKFQHEYHLMPKVDRRTKDGKSAYQAHLDAAGDKVLIDKDTFDKFKHFKPYNETQNEVTVLFEAFGVECKARFDVLHPNGVEDLKTINDIFKVDKQFYNFEYYIQSGFYQLAFKAAFGKYPDFFDFTFISTGDFVVKETFTMDFDYMEIGRDEATSSILQYKEALDKDEWKLGLQTNLEAPKWL